MAIVSDINGDTLTITLGSVGVTGAAEVDVFEDIYEPVKDWYLGSPENRRFPFPFVSDGGNPLTSIINQGGYLFLRNDIGWRIKPFEEDGTTFLIGNLAVSSTALPAFRPTVGGFTHAVLGLQPITQGVTSVLADQLAFASFEGAVHVNVLSGISGTGLTAAGEPIGNVKNPVDNLADSLVILGEVGLDEINVTGDLTFNGGLDYSDLKIVGQGKNLSTLTIDPSANVLNCSFFDATITGTLDGQSILTDCVITGLNFVSGVIDRCILENTTITLGGGVEATFLDCYSGVPGTGTPTIDMGGSGQPLALRGYAGGVRIENKTGPEAVSVDLRSGQVVIDLTTVTNGTIVVRGDGKVMDQAGNLLVSGVYGSMVLVNETISGVMVREIWQMLNLDPDTPVVIDSTSISFGGVTIDITGTTTKTFTRQP